MIRDGSTSEGKMEHKEVQALQDKLAILQQIKDLKDQIGYSPVPNVTNNAPQPATQSIVKNVKVPEGRYNMSLAEYRTYVNDCNAYQVLTGYTDNQIVLQLRLNMDAELKRSVDVNYPDWHTKSVGEAVYRKEFDNMGQTKDEPIREFATRLRSCALDCSFICPYDDNHDLTDYHIINRIRSGIYNKTLQQEILQKHSTLNDLPTLVKYCEDFESALLDQEKLSKNADTNNFDINSLSTEFDVGKDETVPALSSYRREKKNQKGVTPMQK